MQRAAVTTLWSVTLSLAVVAACSQGSNQPSVRAGGASAATTAGSGSLSLNMPVLSGVPAGSTVQFVLTPTAAGSSPITLSQAYSSGTVATLASIPANSYTLQVNVLDPSGNVLFTGTSPVTVTANGSAQATVDLAPPAQTGSVAVTLQTGTAASVSPTVTFSTSTASGLGTSTASSLGTSTATGLPPPPATTTGWTPGPGLEGCNAQGNAWVAVNNGGSGSCGDPLVTWCCSLPDIQQRFENTSGAPGTFNVSGLAAALQSPLNQGLKLYNCSYANNVTTFLFAIQDSTGVHYQYVTVGAQSTASGGTPAGQCPQVTSADLGITESATSTATTTPATTTTTNTATAASTGGGW